MDGIGISTAVAGAEVVAPTSITVMKNVLTVVMGGGMMIEIIIMRAGEGLGVEALGVVEGEAGALVGGGIGAQLGRVVLRGGLKLNNGTGKENKQQQEIGITVPTMTPIARVTYKMVSSSMTTSSSNEEDMVIDVKKCEVVCRSTFL